MRKTRSVMANVLTSGLEVSEFELQSRYYVHFRTNTTGKGMNYYSPSYGLNSITAILPQGWLWCKKKSLNVNNSNNNIFLIAMILLNYILKNTRKATDLQSCKDQLTTSNLIGNLTILTNGI